MTEALRALIIEDVEDDALLMLRALKRHHPDVRHERAESESELRAALGASAWDIALSDYTLPGFDARRAYDVIREFDEDLPFIIVSGTIGEEHAVEAMRAGVDDCVMKDDLARLPLVIERALRDAGRTRQHRDLERRLRTAQRLESLGRLAGTVAHDFNNMVMVVESYGHLVLEQLPEGHPAGDDVRVMRDAARRASDLTRQLLAFSRRQTMQVRRTTLDDVVGQVTPLLGRLIGEDVELRVERCDDAGAVEVDPSQLEQIVMNLAVNARDAMPRGGVLSIATEQVRVEETDRSAFDVSPGSYACLRVTDTGVGMDSETAQHIFEPFFTTKGEGHGTGLGLSTVYGIVKQCGGDVTVESAPGNGSTFRLLLPMAEPQPEPAPRPATARPVGHGRGRTVLLVEDDEALRRGVRRILHRAGHRVIEAGDGGDALRIAQSHEGPIDLLVTDLVMPNVGGRELVDRFARLYPDAPVLLMSGYAEDRGPEAGLVSDEVVFLPKPFSPAQLLEKVGEALRP